MHAELMDFFLGLLLDIQLIGTGIVHLLHICHFFELGVTLDDGGLRLHHMYLLLCLLDLRSKSRGHPLAVFVFLAHLACFELELELKGLFFELFGSHAIDGRLLVCALLSQLVIFSVLSL
jgi:hypothetical protein